MPLAETSELVRSAVRAGRAVCAFNVITVEHAEAIVTGAEQAGTPVILQISENAVRFHGGHVRPIAAAAAAVARLSDLDASLHLDHVTDLGLLHQARTAGFSSVMYDASTRPFEANVAATRQATRWAHDNGLWVEAELGAVAGKPGAHAGGARTEPAEAQAYVAVTGVDALAVAVGSRHAMTERTAELDHALIADLRAAVPVPLVLHGSSGVREDELRRAIRGGLAKVNIGTALNVAYTDAVRAGVGDPRCPVDPRGYLSAARDAMARTVRDLLRSLTPEPSAPPDPAVPGR